MKLSIVYQAEWTYTCTC